MQHIFYHVPKTHFVIILSYFTFSSALRSCFTTVSYYQRKQLDKIVSKQSTHKLLICSQKSLLKIQKPASQVLNLGSCSWNTLDMYFSFQWKLPPNIYFAILSSQLCICLRKQKLKAEALSSLLAFLTFLKSDENVLWKRSQDLFIYLFCSFRHQMFCIKKNISPCHCPKWQKRS